MAHEARHVERGGEPGLTVVEQVAEALVGLLRGAEARELPHRPQAAAVHRRVDTAGERELTRVADVLLVLADVLRAVERLDRLAAERVTLSAVGVWRFSGGGPGFHCWD